MATITAQFLVGTSHLYHDGIIPSHQIFLYENSRPSFQLMQMVPPHNNIAATIWIPTVEDMVHDVMVMINVCILGKEEIKDELARYFPGGFSRVDNMFNIPEQSRKNLYKLCQHQKYPDNFKIVVTVLNDSSLLKQLTAMRSYAVKTELCLSTQERV